MKLLKSFLLFLIILFLHPKLYGNVDINGYFENRFFLINDIDLSWNEFNKKIKLADYNRLRLKLHTKPFDKVSVNLALDFFSFHGQMNSPFGTQSENQNQNSKDILIDLDRAYADLHFKKFDLTIGKQRIAMGVSYLWSPLDIFNRVNLFEPKEEKPGVNAIKIYIPFGDFSSFTGVFSPDENFNGSKSGFRIQTQLFKIDMAFTLIRAGDIDMNIYGLDVRGENFLGWWIETALFKSENNNEFKTVLGFDYTFNIGSGLYWLNEFYYDSGGEKDTQKYDYNLLIQGDRFTLGRNYYLSMLKYGFSDLISGSISYIANWNDGSFILNPNLQYEIFQNTNISTGLYLPIGKEDEEFSNSKKTVFYIWLKIFF